MTANRAASAASAPRPAHRGDPAATLAQDGIGSLAELKAATMRCRECPIGEFATQSVVGEGAARAKLMLVGEQPGDQEDLQGHPFIGPAGCWKGRWTRSGSRARRYSCPTP